MNIKALSLCIIACLFFLSGCDPKAILDKKIPEPVKELLSSSPGGKKLGSRVQEAALINFSIISPRANSVRGVGEDVVFQAKLSGPLPGGEGKPQVIWTLSGGKGGTGVQIGRGETVHKKLDAGRYKVQATLVMKNLKVAKSIPFRVTHQTYGKITTYEGSPLPDVNLALSEIGTERSRFQARSGKDGQFSIEIPKSGSYELSVAKKGYSFEPSRRVVMFTDPPVSQDFKAVKAEIKNLAFTEDPKGDTGVEFVCPLQEGYLGFSVQSDAKPESVEAQLVRVEEGVERPLQLEDISESTAGKGAINTERTVIKVLVPAAMAVGPTRTSYRLRLTVRDDKKQTYSVEFPQSFDYDMRRCFRKTLADGIDNQVNGKPEQAIASYLMIDSYEKRLDDPTPFASFTKQSTFNRALAYLTMAIEKPADSIDRLTLLNRAEADLQSVLESNRGDLDAMLLLGWAFHLAGDASKAEEYYNKVLEAEPNFRGAHELRAHARLELVGDRIRHLKRDISKLKQGSKNPMELSQDLIKSLKRIEGHVKGRMLGALDDFTEALSTHPDDKSIRASRRQLLGMVHGLNESEVNISEFSVNVRNLLAKKEHAEDLGHPLLAVDVSKVSVRDLTKVIDPTKLIRK
jgi:tetratricopeptide (TPR) repeat protein